MYYYPTPVGTFVIAERFGRWHDIFDGESLGSYANPRQAADDVAGGHTFSAGPGIDTAELGIPGDIGEWKTGIPTIT